MRVDDGLGLGGSKAGIDPRASAILDWVRDPMQGERMMVASKSNVCSSIRFLPWFQVRIWHLALLVLLVAVAMIDIQDHRPRSPALLGLAAIGYAGYFVIVWLCWLYARRFERSLGLAVLLAVFVTAMAALFLVATMTYLVIESIYLYY
jgi:hypothetical protein